MQLPLFDRWNHCSHRARTAFAWDMNREKFCESIAVDGHSRTSKWKLFFGPLMFQNWIGTVFAVELRKDYVRNELFTNILNEFREQSVNHHNTRTEEAKKSEYSDRFHRQMCVRNDAVEVGGSHLCLGISNFTIHFQEQNIIRHQLYGPPSEAITFWSSQNSNANFKQRHPLTKPNGEYFDGQWR